jgi:alpha-N-arabinofuranosidase
MTGIMEFAGIWKKHEQVYAAPAYYVFRMYTAVKGDIVLPVSTNSGSYNVAGGARPLDQVNDIPYIDVVATLSPDGKTMTLLCVNRSLNLDVSTSFDLGSLQLNGSAQSEQIHAANRYELNDEVEPNHVVPALATIPSPVSGPLSVTLPRESVTVLRVPVE